MGVSGSAYIVYNASGGRNVGSFGAFPSAYGTPTSEDLVGVGGSAYAEYVVYAVYAVYVVYVAAACAMSDPSEPF